MKFLLQNNRVSINITRLMVVLKIFMNHFIIYAICAPNTVPEGSKMPTLIPLRKFRVFFSQSSGSSAFQPFDNIAYIQQWSALNMVLHMVFANNPLKCFHIFQITNWFNKLAVIRKDNPFQNFISIFCNPNYVGCKLGYCVTTFLLLFTHKVRLSIFVATESLVLKA